MLRIIRDINVLNKIFNVRSNEWPKIMLCWFIRFFYRVGFVIGWTVIVAFFVSTFGIVALPYLFVIVGVFTILGSIIYSTVLDKFKGKALILINVGLSILLLLFAAYFHDQSVVLFYALLIVVISVFMVQVRMMLSGYIEEMFSALESERTFPLIEASETVAGILAGGLVSFFSATFTAPNFILMWTLSLVLMFPLLLIHFHSTPKIAHFHEEGNHKSPGLISEMKMVLVTSRYAKYIWGLFTMVLIQWILYNLMEFQYTVAVFDNVSEVVLEGGSGFEHTFVHDLGILYMIFSTSSLAVQLFAGGRLINYLGIVGTMLLHMVVTLLSAVGMVLNFSFNTAVLAKNNFTITSILHTNAYHSSYYAVSDRLRLKTREVLEGFARPLGAILGTAVIIILQWLLPESKVSFGVNLMFFVFVILGVYSTYLLQERYSSLAKADLLSSGDLSLRLTAVDILAQKGHRGSLDVFTKVLKKKSTPVAIKVKILRSLSEFNHKPVLPVLLSYLKSKDKFLREAALDGLLNCKRLVARSSKSDIFAKYNLFSMLKDCYEHEKVEHISSRMVRLMSQVSGIATLEFLMEVMKKGSTANKVEAMKALVRFEDADVVNVVEPYLRSRYDEEKINAAIALHAFPEFKDITMNIIMNFFYSKNLKKKAFAILAFGDLNMRSKRGYCLECLDSGNTDLRWQSALALGKMSDRASVPVLVRMILDAKSEEVPYLRSQIKALPSTIFNQVNRFLNDYACESIKSILSKNTGISLKKMAKADLRDLRSLYILVGDYEEVENLDKLIAK